MRLTKAVFTNYKKLNNISVKLDETTVIIGQNNSGKSTLLDGINNAFSPDASLLTSRYFSKIHKEDASVKIFFKVEDRDVDEILNVLHLRRKILDKLLIRTEFWWNVFIF